MRRTHTSRPLPSQHSTFHETIGVSAIAFGLLKSDKRYLLHSEAVTAVPPVLADWTAEDFADWQEQHR